MQRWVEYFRDTINWDAVEPSISGLEKPPVYDDLGVEAPNISQVSIAIQLLKSNMITELDNIPDKIFKFGGDSLGDHIHQVIVKIWTNESWIDQWKSSWINPIYNDHLWKSEA